jgi:hypothetical protein
MRHHAVRGVRLTLRAQPQPHRQAPARAGANGHQQVHVAGQRLQRMPAGLVKARAQNELHRRGQRKLRQAGSIQCWPNRSPSIGSTSGADSSSPMATGARSRPRATRRVPSRLRGCAARSPASRTARRSSASAWAEARKGDARRFSRQVDRGVLHAWHFLQGLFDAGYTGRAGHAADAEIEGGGSGCGGSVHGVDCEPCHRWQGQALTQINRTANQGFVA